MLTGGCQSRIRGRHITEPSHRAYFRQGTLKEVWSQNVHSSHQERSRAPMHPSESGSLLYHQVCTKGRPNARKHISTSADHLVLKLCKLTIFHWPLTKLDWLQHQDHYQWVAAVESCQPFSIINIWTAWTPPITMSKICLWRFRGTVSLWLGMINTTPVTSSEDIGCMSAQVSSAPSVCEGVAAQCHRGYNQWHWEERLIQSTDKQQ